MTCIPAPNWCIGYGTFPLKGGGNMEMDMQDPGDMGTGIETLVPLLDHGGFGGNTDFG